MKDNNLFVKTTLFVVLAIILTVGVTYAYFRANITGVESESTISIGGATLKIVYEGTETINAENVIPGWSAKKYFNVDVTNTSGKDIEYDINLVVTNSNFNITNDTGNSYLEYALYKCTSNTDTACETVITSSSILDIQSGEKKVYSVKTKTSGKTYYALELSFPNQDAVQSQTGTNDQPLTFNGYVTLVSTGEVYVPPFETDSWATIASNIKSGNTSRYKVGDEKEIAIDGFTNREPGSNGLYTVRLANNSHYYSETTNENECKDNDGNSLTSQTACGFVVEFVDIITGYNMHPSNTNVGGWPATAMYKYLNGTYDSDTKKWNRTDTLYSKLPSDLQSLIVDTTVVSGHGSTSGETNFTSTDKIYLLSTAEVWANGLSDYDTATGVTRQLDFYEVKGVTTKKYGEAKKNNYNGTLSVWWLRTPNLYDNYPFLFVSSNGSWSFSSAGYDYGLAPAFRID